MTKGIPLWTPLLPSPPSPPMKRLTPPLLHSKSKPLNQLEAPPQVPTPTHPVGETRVLVKGGPFSGMNDTYPKPYVSPPPP